MKPRIQKIVWESEAPGVINSIGNRTHRPLVVGRGMYGSDIFLRIRDQEAGHIMRLGNPHDLESGVQEVLTSEWSTILTYLE